MLTEIVNVFIAIALFEIVIRAYDHYKNRKPDLKCDGCTEVKKLYKIRGQNLFYCHRCKQAYLRDQKNGDLMYGTHD